jgi:hypothetical protein
MTRQEAFNISYFGLASQGFRRALNGSTCAYRAPTGSKCAIGHILPDGLYQEWFDLEPVRTFSKVLIACALNPEKDLEWAASLQRCHDVSATPSTMKEALAQFASNENLTIPVEAVS